MLEVFGHTYDSLVENHFRTVDLPPDPHACGAINIEQLSRLPPAMKFEVVLKTSQHTCTNRKQQPLKRIGFWGPLY